MFIIGRNKKRDKESILSEMKRKDFANFRGEVEIIGRDRFGKINYYDFGENTVTVWAKHMTMHLLTGESFSTWGRQRSFSEADHDNITNGEGVNNDGTLLSGEQYFSDNTSPDYNLDARWSKSTIEPSTEKGDAVDDTITDVKYPFFPTKLLFGTGREFQNWNSMPEAFQNYYSDDGWNAGIFDPLISLEDNDYNAQWSTASNDLIKARTVNDIIPEKISTAVEDTEFSILGAVKNGTYNDSSTERYGTGGTEKTFLDGGKEFLTKEYDGVGQPAFIYPTREARFMEPGSEVLLSNDSFLENKITFTVVMPEQTGDNAGIYYPYNGYNLKVAGLFSDAKMLLGNTYPSGSADDHEDELEYFRKMPYGIMSAKRYLSPVFKSHETSLSIRWTIYIG